MEEIKKILAVSWITQYCKATIQAAISLAAKYDAELSVIHVVDTFWLQGWNVPMKVQDEERQKYLERIKSELESVIGQEKIDGLKKKVKPIIREGDPVEEMLKVIEEEKIDVIVLRANQESRFEHFIIGGSNDALIRKMPCSIYLVKNKPGKIAG